MGPFTAPSELEFIGSIAAVGFIATVVWLFRKGRAHAKAAFTDRYEAELPAGTPILAGLEPECRMCGERLFTETSPRAVTVDGIEGRFCLPCVERRDLGLFRAATPTSSPASSNTSSPSSGTG